MIHVDSLKLYKMEGVYESTISTRKRDLLSNCSQKSIKVTRMIL